MLQAGSRVESANVDATMATVNRARTRHGMDRLERNAAEPAGVPADCP
jgi:hypothetical protein